MQLSVVIPTYNRLDLLRDCLDALLKQDFEARDYEIVVVDNAGSAETRQLVESLSANNQSANTGHLTGVRPSIFYLEEAERPGPAAARNLGWKFAHGDIIAFTDDDCVPDRQWLAEGLRQLRTAYDAVTGQVIVPISGVPSDYEKSVARLETAEFVTANCFIRCSALHFIGGFDERFTTAWREDSDLHFSLISHSLKIGRAPLAKVMHPVRPVRWGISLKEQRKSMFNALLFKKYTVLYRQHIQRRPPIRYYAILLFALGAFLSLLARREYTALGMGFIWAALTLQFAMLRLRGTKHTLAHLSEMFVTSLLIPVLSVYWRLYGAVKYRVWFL